MKTYGIILASGSGNRFHSEIPKQFVKIAGKTVLEHTIEVFEKSKDIDDIIIVITPQYRYIFEEIFLKHDYKKIVCILNGGDSRKESSYIGISSIQEKDANVVIHDCARPFLSQRIISDCINALKEYDAVDVAIPSADTIIEINNKNEITNIPNRSMMMRGQTPQCFKLSLIKRAHELSKNSEDFTDDCGLVIKHNLAKVFVVRGEDRNIKITYPEDIFLADKIFQINSVNVSNDQNLDLIKDKVVVVFGGMTGIGEAIINISQNHGAKAYGFSTRNGYDVTKPDKVEKALKEVYEKEGRIDFIANTAGVLRVGKLVDRDIKDIIKEAEINYIGAVNIAKLSIPYLKESKGGLLLFSSSSYTRGRALYSVYSSCKAGIVNLTQALAEELYNDGIKINVINPERTATPMRFSAFGKEPEETLLKVNVVAITSLNVFVSDITGQVIDVRK